MRALLSIMALLSVFALRAQNVGVNANGALPDASALLDVSAAALPANGKRAMLIPRMTSAERSAIPTPATGLLVYDTTNMHFWYYDGTAWVAWLNEMDAWKIGGNSGLTAGTHFIGCVNDDEIELRVNGEDSGILSADVAAFGYRAQRATDNSSTFSASFGFEALGNAVSGTQDANVAVGHQALSILTIGSDHTFVGSDVGMTSVNPSSGSSTAIGHRAIRTIPGIPGTAVGHRALENNTGSNWALAIGAQAHMTGPNVFSELGIGYQAGTNGANGVGRGAAMGDAGHGFGVGACADSDIVGNHGFGYTALNSVTTGNENCAFGLGALATGTNVDDCVAVGMNSLTSATGDGNTAMGFSSLDGVGSGMYNTGFGAFAGPTVSTLNYTSAIGYNAVPTVTGRIVFGTTLSTNLTGGFGAWQNLSDARFKRDVRNDVPGLEMITALRPVTYRLDAPAIERFLGAEARLERNLAAEELADMRTAWADAALVRHTGLLAQEVAAAMEGLGRCKDIVHVPTEEHDHYTVGYASLVVPLVRAVQQQQERIAALRTSNQELHDRLEKAQAHASGQYVVAP